MDATENNMTHEVFSTVYSKFGSRLEGTGNGWTCFPASVFLAQFVANCPSFVKGKHVVELGCGVGLAGIAAATAGAKSVVCTDKDPTVLELAQMNINRNNVGHVARVQVLDWCNQTSWIDALPPCDVILAADVVYNAQVHGDFVNMCEALMPDDGRAIVADPIQRYVRPSFVKLCSNRGLEVGTIFQNKEMVLLNIMPIVGVDVYADK